MNAIPSEITKIIDSQLSNINLIKNNVGIMAGGINGPYFDVETPVRNTAHWLITFSLLFDETKDEKFEAASRLLLNFLLDDNVFCRKGVYVQRQKAGKDWSNGVIGQAWVIESLVIAGKTLGSFEAIERAKRAASSFSFHPKVKAWSRIDSADGKSAIDYTLNHQLWFAAAKLEADISNVGEVDKFLDSLELGSFKIRGNGLICHLLYSSSIKAIILRYRYLFFEKRNISKVIEKENGYHLFNLYPLARLYLHRPEHSFFQNKKFIHAVNYCISEEFIASLEGNKYAYPYNSPAFEIPFILETFKSFLPLGSEEKVLAIQKKLMDSQLKLTFEKESQLLSLNCPDSQTLTARIYEVILGYKYKKLLKIVR